MVREEVVCVEQLELEWFKVILLNLEVSLGAVVSIVKWQRDGYL